MDVYDRNGSPIDISTPIGMKKYGALLADSDYKIVVQSELHGWMISTVWLGIDHSYGLGGPPLIFETMVFPEWGKEGGCGPEEDMDRYSTEADALLGQQRFVEQYFGRPWSKTRVLFHLKWGRRSTKPILKKLIQGDTYMNKRAMVILGAILAVAFVLTGCSAPSTPADEIFVHKGSGITEGKASKGCIEPATREIFWGQGMGDEFFSYPSGQRWFDYSKAEGGDAPPFKVVSKDGQELLVPGRTDFTLNINCDTLTRFHDLVGNREQAYIVDGDNGTRTPGPGWSRILNNYFTLPIDSALDQVAKQYTWRQLRFDLTIKDEMNKAVNASLTRLVNQQISGDDDFFLNFSTLVQQPVAPADLVKTETDRETALAQAATTEAKAKADAAAAQAAATAQIAQKDAELKVAQKEAEIRAAEIRSFGGPEAYAKWQAVQKGINPWQPSYGGNSVITP